MELNSEERVTRLLTQNEIITGRLNSCPINGPYNLYEIIDKIKKEPSQYDERFMFIK